MSALGRRLVVLYAQSRHLAFVAGSSVLFLTCGSGWVAWRHASFDDQVLGQSLPALFMGILVGVTTASPFGELEDAAPDRAVPLRAIAVGGLMMAVCLVYAAVSWFWPRPDAPAALVRGLLGFAGLTVVALRFVGPGRAWIPGLIWGLVALVSVQSDWTYPIWAWSMQPGDDPASWVVALSLAMAGAAVLARTPFALDD